MTLTDDLERARRGDGRAFESLARAHERALYSHVARIVGPGPDAEDVVQDAFISAWRSVGRFEGTSFKAWLFRIARNRAIDVVRARKRKGELPLEPPDDGLGTSWAEPAAGGPELADIASGHEARGAVEQALALVPVEQRDALLLRDVEGFSYDEIAVITASEIGTVKSRIHRARLAARNSLIARGWRGSAG
ncbi:MAG TPA: sigma-70 family RNA polymerase sigma factor [Candidatus Limnocylindria bacterium]|nr:sigma-70 family RNA polymerase sigma factor [Candidatus Limnocylindria bacterium]